MAHCGWQWLPGTFQAPHLQVAPLLKNKILWPAQRRQILLTLTITTTQVLTLSDCSISHNLYHMIKLTRHGYPWCSKGWIWGRRWTQAEYSRGKSAVWCKLHHVCLEALQIERGLISIVANRRPAIVLGSRSWHHAIGNVLSDLVLQRDRGCDMQRVGIKASATSVSQNSTYLEHACRQERR